uniref:PH domain-containing protein n=1 Tax=Sinocyclocheilus grahami TaxID=75366 RepID=A0A672SS89_SINGR
MNTSLTFGNQTTSKYFLYIVSSFTTFLFDEIFSLKVSLRSVSRLELKQGSSKRKPDYKQVIRLRECIQISEREIADCPKDCAAFYLETSDKVYMFAAQRSELKDWIKSLCEQAFPVGSITSNHSA